jgi:hypothetical protein
MSQPEWIEPRLAIYRLADHWNIPLRIAEEIIRGVLLSGDVLVRGRDYSRDTCLRSISKEIGATLSPGSLNSWKFSDVEMDWNGLLKHGRNLVPDGYEYWVSAAIEKSEAHPPKAPKRTKRDAVATFIKEKYPDGKPAGITYQEIAREFERSRGLPIDPRTVMRALGHK